MKALTPVLVILVLIAGCGRDDEASLSPEETAHEWVEAVNADDFDRACDLSVFPRRPTASTCWSRAHSAMA